MATPIEQLDAMRALAPNWDGYNADPPDPAVIEVAKEFVALLTAFRAGDRYEGVSVYPGRAGGVLIEWSDEKFDHELEIDPDGKWGFLHIDRATGQTSERTFSPTRHVIHPGVLKEIREMMVA